MADSTIPQLPELVNPSGQEFMVVDSGAGARKVRIENFPSGPQGEAGVNANVAFVQHGSNTATARPSGFAQVIWYGSVQPANAVAPDLVIRIDETVPF